MRPYQVVKSEIKKLGRFEVCMDTIEIDGKRYPYSYTKVHESVCVLPIIKKDSDAFRAIANDLQEDWNVGLIYQYRHALDKWIYEIVAGGIEDDEMPEQAAIRELKEETGLIVTMDHLISLGQMYPVSGTSNEKMHVFAALCDSYSLAQPEPTEFLELKLVSVKDFQMMIQNNIFQNMYGIVAWYKFYQKYNQWL